MNNIMNQDPAAAQDEYSRLLTEADGERVIREVVEQCEPEADLGVFLMSYWGGSLKWARNRAAMTADRRDVQLLLTLRVRRSHQPVAVATNQIDSESVAAAVRLLNKRALQKASNRPLDRQLEILTWDTIPTTVWSDNTFNRPSSKNGELVNRLTDRSEAEGLLSAGFLESRGISATHYSLDPFGRDSRRFGRLTQAQCSVTVRNPQGSGSGWAGLSSYDFSVIDESAIANLALDKCIASVDAVRIEPGRYTTILEPQASSTMLEVFVRLLRRPAPEQGQGPLTLGADALVGRYLSKLGLKVVDERVTISHDPSDPLTGILSTPSVEAVTLIKNGILTTLYNSPQHALNELGEAKVSAARKAFYMHGGNTSVEEMISSTERGLIVTRLSNTQLVDADSVLLSGLTRDGLWLIEGGKITRAVRNFRFTESPWFMMNNIEQIGPSVPVWHPVDNPSDILIQPESSIAPIVVPTLKINDFSFTSTVDAV